MLNAKKTATNLFQKGIKNNDNGNGDDLPTIRIKMEKKLENHHVDGKEEEEMIKISLIDVLIQLKFETSKAASRRLISGGGARINGNQVCFLFYNIYISFSPCVYISYYDFSLEYIYIYCFCLNVCVLLFFTSFVFSIDIVHN